MEQTKSILHFCNQCPRYFETKPQLARHCGARHERTLLLLGKIDCSLDKAKYWPLRSGQDGRERAGIIKSVDDCGGGSRRSTDGGRRRLTRRSKMLEHSDAWDCFGARNGRSREKSVKPAGNWKDAPMSSSSSSPSSLQFPSLIDRVRDYQHAAGEACGGWWPETTTTSTSTLAQYMRYLNEEIAHQLGVRANMAAGADAAGPVSVGGSSDSLSKPRPISSQTKITTAARAMVPRFGKNNSGISSSEKERHTKTRTKPRKRTDDVSGDANKSKDYLAGASGHPRAGDREVIERLNELRANDNARQDDDGGGGGGKGRVDDDLDTWRSSVANINRINNSLHFELCHHSASCGRGDSGDRVVLRLPAPPPDTGTSPPPQLAPVQLIVTASQIVAANQQEQQQEMQDENPGRGSKQALGDQPIDRVVVNFCHNSSSSSSSSSNRAGQDDGADDVGELRAKADYCPIANNSTTGAVSHVNNNWISACRRQPWCSSECCFSEAFRSAMVAYLLDEQQQLQRAGQLSNSGE